MAATSHPLELAITSPQRRQSLRRKFCLTARPLHFQALTMLLAVTCLVSTNQSVRLAAPNGQCKVDFSLSPTPQPSALIFQSRQLPTATSKSLQRLRAFFQSSRTLVNPLGRHPAQRKSLSKLSLQVARRTSPTLRSPTNEPTTSMTLRTYYCFQSFLVCIPFLVGWYFHLVFFCSFLL